MCCHIQNQKVYAAIFKCTFCKAEIISSYIKKIIINWIVLGLQIKLFWILC